MVIIKTTLKVVFSFSGAEEILKYDFVYL